MKKSILEAVVLTLLLVGFMCIPGKEGSVSFAVENLWTTTRDPFLGRPPLQHIRFRSRYAPIPNGSRDFFRGKRWHFGFPCWAFYVDVGTVENRDTKHSLEPKVWYAKLDLYRTLINGLVGLVAGFSLIGFYHFIRSKGLKKPPISLMTKDFGLNEE